MTTSQRYFRLAILGVILGAIATVMGYGAGGFLLLSIVVGSIVILLRTKAASAVAILIYTSSICASFFVFGLRIISDPLSMQVLLIFLCMIAIPTGLAVALDYIRGMYRNPK